MVTLCWAAKGGSGTTVVAAALAIASPTPTLLVDLDGEVPTVLGMPQPDRPGVADWLEATGQAAVTRLGVDAIGRVCPDELAAAIAQRGRLVANHARVLLNRLRLSRQGGFVRPQRRRFH